MRRTQCELPARFLAFPTGRLVPPPPSAHSLAAGAAYAMGANGTSHCAGSRTLVTSSSE